MEAKRIETRSWQTAYRGRLAIHPSKGFPQRAKDGCLEEPFRQVLLAHGITGTFKLPLGAVIATCNLVDCLPMSSVICLPGVFDDYPELDTPQERAFGDYTAGRWAWVINGVEPLPEPIPAKGALSLWEWELPALPIIEPGGLHTGTGRTN